MTDTLRDAAERFTRWLDRRLQASARGDNIFESQYEPSGRFWLGVLWPEERVIGLQFGDRAERITPCAVGIRVRPAGALPWSFEVCASLRVWTRGEDKIWRKSAECRQCLTAYVSDESLEPSMLALNDLGEALAKETGVVGLAAEVRVDVERGRDGFPDCIVRLINTSSVPPNTSVDPNFYEVSLTAKVLRSVPFLLEALPDSFRYDRRIPAYGLNCGVSALPGGGVCTLPAVSAEIARPIYWTDEAPEPDLTFETLASDPLPSLKLLVDCHSAWGARAWSKEALDTRAREGRWSDEMRQEAAREAEAFQSEADRMRDGLRLLESADGLVLGAYQLMNRAIAHSSRGKYQGWRPFQVGFQLTALRAVLGEGVAGEPVDVLWFSTGGGKTETYLGLVVVAAVFDRMRGKLSGVTAWSRFPLRLLSLQQTQRFADAVAGAEIERRRAGLPGDPFSLGFFVGAGNTPNRIRPDPGVGEPDPFDENMPSAYSVLLECPFCFGPLQMTFDHERWALQHRCINEKCPWPDDALPFYIVDEEIYRFLPTVIVGTLDKVASLGIQGAMRGLVGAPWGLCSSHGHGYTYAPRAERLNGCLVPGCRGVRQPLPQRTSLYRSTFRLQDELHLIRDSLGAVDSHYESLVDHLETHLSGGRSSILASSATLTGCERQTRMLYRRESRIFPRQGPEARNSFWTGDSSTVLRRYVALAPMGVTHEFAADRILTELQEAIRELNEHPARICDELGVDPALSPALVDLYGTNVVYGNTIRDLEASVRSLETQVPVGRLNVATLTGSTPFESVRSALQRLQSPEVDFFDRIHVVAASAMMSHGVDLDRLNVMVMLGQPLATAEFMQISARIGRRWPGLVIVLHRMARERDASLYRTFVPFVEQGDRFVEAIPVTRRSRRVLERTLPGLEMARLLMIHEERAGSALTTVAKLRAESTKGGFSKDVELDALIEMLGFAGPLDEGLRTTLQEWLDTFFRNLAFPSSTVRFPNDLSPTGRPMLSLRDVEEQSPVHD